MLLLCFVVGTLTGCGAQMVSPLTEDFLKRVIDRINAVRDARDLPLLQYDEILNRTAAARVEIAAAKGEVSPESNRLPALTAAGSYARFALSHELVAESHQAALKAVTESPLCKSKVLHPRITHLGLGVKKKGGKVYMVLDLARVMSKADLEATKRALVDQLEQKRLLNSVDPLDEKKQLSDIAEETAQAFIEQKGTTDSLIAEAQAKVGGSTVAFGRVTVNFQVASDADSIAIPERASDPKLGFVGIGMAQGNHPDHEPGSIAVVMLLTEPQNDHDARRNYSNVPPPKAVPKDQGNSRQPLTDQAWVATLAGNHQKAAKLFEKAYRTKKNPALIYEAARAHARDENIKAALEQMRRYAELVQGEEKKKALEMASLLKKGDTIFTSSEKEKMSVEAKRFFVMGQTLFEREQWDGAVDAFQQAYQYSQNAEIIYNIGLVHLRAGRIGDALDFFGEYQRLVPEATNVDEARQLFEIGVQLYQQGQFESASRHFAMAYGFLPFPELVYNMALCYKAMGEKKKAIRFFMEFLSNELTLKERRDVEALLQELNTN
jgi:tetratricopeptide (TPR) repeat protein